MLEKGLREALFCDGASALSELLNAAAGSRPKVPSEGITVFRDRPKTIVTMLGEVTFQRDYHYDPAKKAGTHPLDDVLGLIDGYSPGTARMMCRAGATGSYDEGAQDLFEYAGLTIESRQIQRIVQKIGPECREWMDRNEDRSPAKDIAVIYIQADGSGVPMRKADLKGRPGRQPDGTSKTWEGKIGCIFTQSCLDDSEPEPWRDTDSTSYIGTMERCEAFGLRLSKESLRRGIGRAHQQIFLCDAAAWLLEIKRQHFPQAVLIIDFYHAGEHLTNLAKLLLGPTQAANELAEKWREQLLADGVDTVIKEALQRLGAIAEPERLKEAQKQIAYFENHQEHMRYGTYRTSGWFIGSGVVEAGCRRLIGLRMKQSGMFWSVPGAENVLALRSAILANRFNSYWKARATRAA